MGRVSFYGTRPSLLNIPSERSIPFFASYPSHSWLQSCQEALP